MQLPLALSYLRTSPAHMARAILESTSAEVAVRLESLRSSSMRLRSQREEAQQALVDAGGLHAAAQEAYEGKRQNGFGKSAREWRVYWIQRHADDLKFESRRQEQQVLSQQIRELEKLLGGADDVVKSGLEVALFSAKEKMERVERVVSGDERAAARAKQAEYEETRLRSELQQAALKMQVARRKVEVLTEKLNQTERDMKQQEQKQVTLAAALKRLMPLDLSAEQQKRMEENREKARLRKLARWAESSEASQWLV